VLVIKVWNVIIGVTPVAFGCIVGDAQVVKSWQEHQDANDQDRNGPVCPHFADIACQQGGAYDNEKGASQKQHCREHNGLIWDLRRAFLKLEEKQTKKDKEEHYEYTGLRYFKAGRIRKINLSVS
jgi:hypothetical protein